MTGLIIFSIIFGPLIILGVIGTILDKMIYIRQIGVVSIFDPRIKEAYHTWRQIAVFIWLDYMVVFYFYLDYEKNINVNAKISNADFLNKIVLMVCSYQFHLIAFIIGISFFLFFSFRFRRIREEHNIRKFNDKEKNFILATSFNINSTERLATKEDISLVLSIINGIKIRIQNPLGRGISFTLDDKHSLYNELGSLLQEKIHKLRISLEADKEWIYFWVRENEFLKAEENMAEIINILREVRKELLYRKNAGFTYYRNE